SPLAVAYAREHAARRGACVTFFEHDAVSQTLPDGYDILTSSLFLHHLAEAEALGFLRSLAAAGELAIVDDLRRGLPGWAVAHLGTRLLSRSRVAHVDGPRSVEGAFTTDEVRDLAHRAGWDDFEVRPRWPWRMLLIGRFG
ncbi:MAG: hypothetical protein U0790_22110, partial [Isosphaeraceae bacterium]